MSTKELIATYTSELRDLLVKKNEQYGDAALMPLRVFSKANAEYGIRQRIDDKLKRIQSVGINDDTEDTLMDLAGYLILLMISRDERHDIQKHSGPKESYTYPFVSSTATYQGRYVQGKDREDS